MHQLHCAYASGHGEAGNRVYVYVQEKVSAERKGSRCAMMTSSTSVAALSLLDYGLFHRLTSAKQLRNIGETKRA